MLAPTGLLDPVRDPAAAARWMVPFLLAGGAYSFAWVFAVTHTGASPFVIGLLLGLALCTAAGAAWWRRRSMPQPLMALCGPGGVMLVAAANMATHDTSAGSQMFVLCPIVYCASFLSVRLNVISVALAGLGAAVLMMPVMPAADAAANVVGVGVALTVTVAAILAWRRRADEALAQLNALAVEDPLTGLVNRRAFDHEFMHATARAERAGVPLSLLLVDIDRFKVINDTRGHQAGDRVLVAAAAALREAVRRADIVARIGGDEFALLLFACPQDEALRIALGVLDRLRELEGGGLTVTASCGIATTPPADSTPPGMMAAADEALYRAKREGRDGVAMASAPMPGGLRTEPAVDATVVGLTGKTEGP